MFSFPERKQLPEWRRSSKNYREVIKEEQFLSLCVTLMNCSTWKKEDGLWHTWSTGFLPSTGAAKASGGKTCSLLKAPDMRQLPTWISGVEDYCGKPFHNFERKREQTDECFFVFCFLRCFSPQSAPLYFLAWSLAGMVNQMFLEIPM